MTRYSIAVAARIDAAAADVYRVLADYRAGHPRILPPRYFRDLQVERGGVGEGTVIRFEMRALGTRRAVRAVVAEPEPGRVLAETDLATGARTTFAVTPIPFGGVEVTITTELRGRGGILGRIERLAATRLLRAVYREELALLDAVVRAGDLPDGDVPSGDRPAGAAAAGGAMPRAARAARGPSRPDSTVRP